MAKSEVKKNKRYQKLGRNFKFVQTGQADETGQRSKVMGFKISSSFRPLSSLKLFVDFHGSHVKIYIGYDGLHLQS